MLFANLLKKRQARKKQHQNMQALRARISRNQETVYRTLVLLRKPSNGREVAAELGWDSASVTNRLAELTHKERIQIAFRKRGLDGIWRNYYIVKKNPRTF